MKNFGGLLIHGIPDFRLPRDIVKHTIKRILDLGIDVFLGKEFGKDFTLSDLKEKYNAVLLCFGSNISLKMNIDGEDLKRSIWRK